MKPPVNQSPVRTGTFLCDGSIRGGVAIFQTDFIPGSGDDEDPPEQRDDQFGTFFEIYYRSPGEQSYCSHGGWHPDLASACAAVELAAIDIHWDSEQGVR